MTRVKVTVLSDASARSLVRALVAAFVAETDISADDARRLEMVVDGFVGFTLDQAYPGGALAQPDNTMLYPKYYFQPTPPKTTSPPKTTTPPKGKGNGNGNGSKG